MKECQKLSRAQREATPFGFCLFILARIKEEFGEVAPTILWTMKESNWARLYPWVNLLPPGSDACQFTGPGPIIAHPPCGPWGKLQSYCRQSREDGLKAIDLVHQFGGVIEHPLGSSLFADHGRPGSRIEHYRQGDFGHLAIKPTLLYWVFRPACRPLFRMPAEPSPGQGE